MANYPGALIPVVWAGTDWNAGDLADGSCSVITDVQGWYGTPGLIGNDVALALSDGVLRGSKLLAQREITLSGVIMGPRVPVLSYARQLGGLAAERDEVSLQVGVTDETGSSNQMLTCQVRADTSQLQVAWLGRNAIQWQVVLTAADPLLYDAQPQYATLTVPSSATGRVYPRGFGWHYAGLASNSAPMLNAGNVPAPALLTFTGPLASTPQVTDGTNSIFLANLGAGEVVFVESDTLAAWAPGGATRASYILQGSRPMLLPTGTTVWSLYATGAGNVALTWQSAWA